MGRKGGQALSKAIGRVSGQATGWAQVKSVFRQR